MEWCRAGQGQVLASTVQFGESKTGLHKVQLYYKDDRSTLPSRYIIFLWIQHIQQFISPFWLVGVNTWLHICSLYPSGGLELLRTILYCHGQVFLLTIQVSPIDPSAALSVLTLYGLTHRHSLHGYWQAPEILLYDRHLKYANLSFMHCYILFAGNGCMAIHSLREGLCIKWSS